mgnify:CR=1 FL=1
MLGRRGVWKLLCLPPAVYVFRHCSLDLYWGLSRLGSRVVDAAQGAREGRGRAAATGLVGGVVPRARARHMRVFYVWRPLTCKVQPPHGAAWRADRCRELARGGTVRRIAVEGGVSSDSKYNPSCKREENPTQNGTRSV